MKAKVNRPIGTQLLLSHVYDASPYGNTSFGDLSFFSNSQLIGHRVTDYKLVFGGGKPAGIQTYSSTTDSGGNDMGNGFSDIE